METRGIVVGVGASGAVGSAGASLRGTVIDVTSPDELRMHVAATLDFRVPGREELEHYFTERVDGRIIWNMSISKFVIDGLLGVGTKKVPATVTQAQLLASNFVLDEEQVAHLLAYERRVTVWKVFLCAQPRNETIRAQLSAIGFGRRLTAYLRDPNFLRRGRDAAALQRESRECCKTRQCLGAEDCRGTKCAAPAVTYNPHVKLDIFTWSLSRGRGASAYEAHGLPASEWLVGQLGCDTGAWDLFFALSERWESTVDELVSCVVDLLRDNNAGAGAVLSLRSSPNG